MKPINAQAPRFTGLPKIHKENVPIRPLINYTSAPTYKTAKKLAQIIKKDVYKRQHLYIAIQGYPIYIGLKTVIRPTLDLDLLLRGNVYSCHIHTNTRIIQ